MKVKARNLIEVIIAAILLVLIFLQPFYNGYTIKADNYIVKYDGSADAGTITWGKRIGWSVFRLSQYSGSGTFATSTAMKYFFSYALLALSVVSLVLFIIQFVSKKKNFIFTLIPPVLQAIVLAIYTFSAAHYSDIFKNYDYNKWAGTYEKDVMRPATYFWVFLVLLLVLLCISIIGFLMAKKRGVIESNPAPQPVAKEPSVEETATAIQKYKELLDSGAITEEEFDKKKKELLSL